MLHIFYRIFKSNYSIKKLNPAMENIYYFSSQGLSKPPTSTEFLEWLVKPLCSFLDVTKKHNSGDVRP